MEHKFKIGDRVKVKNTTKLVHNASYVDQKGVIIKLRKETCSYDNTLHVDVRFSGGVVDTLNENELIREKLTIVVQRRKTKDG